jgi:hypothetical protein
MNLDTKDTKSKKPREKRCPNGTRKNKKTGNCDPITTLDSLSETNIENVATSAVFNSEKEPVETNIENVATSPLIESVKKKKNKTIKSNDKRCPNGTRRNPKTGICEPINPITITNPRESELPEPPVRTSFKKSSAVIENMEIDSNEPTEKADTLINIDSSISGLDKESNNYLLKKEKLEYDYNSGFDG